MEVELAVAVASAVTTTNAGGPATAQADFGREARGQQLRTFRQSRGMGLRTFARELGWDFALLSAVERAAGKHTIGPQRRAHIAQTFGVPVSAIWPAAPEAKEESER